MGIIAAIIIHFVIPLSIRHRSWPGNAAGFLLAITGAAIAFWAVIVAGDADMPSPGKLITTGPYAFSRNPMYVAWTILTLGIAFIVNTWWLVVALPLVVLFTHYRVIIPEEHFLEEHFGHHYRQYCRQVRRYF